MSTICYAADAALRHGMSWSRRAVLVFVGWDSTDTYAIQLLFGMTLSVFIAGHVRQGGVICRVA
ncbi:MAG: hypothetical protein AAFO75_05615 [Pseudomonadota bacterium]